MTIPRRLIRSPASTDYVKCESCHTPGRMAKHSTRDCRSQVVPIVIATRTMEHLKQGCDSCHTTLTWKKSRFTETFDHSKTGYPLLGKHLEVPCLSCHHAGDFKTPIAHDACADCHKPDPHGGQFAKRADGGRCESCHTVQGWSPSTFSVADHAKTGFPLDLSACNCECALHATCPPARQRNSKSNSRPAWIAIRTSMKGQFAGEPWRNRCEQCHNGATFKTTNFTLAEAPEVGLSAHRRPHGRGMRRVPQACARYESNTVPFQSTQLYNLPRRCT